MSKGKSARGGSGGKLGRSLIKDWGRSNRHTRGNGGGWLHSCDLEDGYEWGRLNLRSVTEQSNLAEFLSTAELAGIEFKAEKLNIKIVGTDTYTGLPTKLERAEAREVEQENVQYLSIPRRPDWDSSTSAEQLEIRERESFLEWRRSLICLEEDERLILTPFEKNLGFWRQLWRVVERSDILVQIVDARNPLLFRCEDLEKYLLEINPKKINMLLISKADLLTPKQRQEWADYFRKNTSIMVAFWSAMLETEDFESDPDRTSNLAAGVESVGRTQHLEDTPITATTPTETAAGVERTLTAEITADVDATPTPVSVVMKCESGSDLLTKEELIALFHEISPTPSGSLTTVGMVGYPNVGKSSTINALFERKKVPVSATPGRTKHFQTLYLSDDLMVCDCPGLVFPSFLSSKAEMVCCGILPIDQLRAHVPPVSLVCERIPRRVLETAYGIRIPPPREGEDENRPPYAHELLASYGYMRGFMTSHGRPDEPRSARYILKDYVNGRLLYCHPPPGHGDQEFNEQLFPEVVQGKGEVQGEGHGAADNTSNSNSNSSSRIMGEFDSEYFQQEQVRAVTKGHGISQHSALQSEITKKPWKKHHNHHKKEKIRRTIPNSY